MSKASHPVLEYRPLKVDGPKRFVAWLVYICLDRPFRPIEAMMLLVCSWTPLYLLSLLLLLTDTRDLLANSVTALAFTLQCAIAVVSFRFFGGFRWRVLKPILISLVFVLVTVPTIECDHCPHASYFLVYDHFLIIIGRPCGNVRQLHLWWQSR